MTAQMSAPMIAIAMLLAGCPTDPEPEPFTYALPPGFPEYRVPTDNPMSDVKVELGRRLFYDVRLSANMTQSCGTCHRQEFAFTDGRATAMGSTGQVHPRGSMGLANVAYQATFTWANPLVVALEDQALLPMFGEMPIVELGLSGMENVLLERMRTDATYPGLFARSFPSDADPISVANVTRAIAAFERVLVSGRSPYDRFTEGDAGALSEAAQRGRELFFSENFECFHCHGGFNFSASVDHAGVIASEPAFFNTGLYNTDGRGAYPPDNEGVYEITGEDRDRGRFKPPSLRNVTLTAPYMHDGSIATLEDVLAFYSAGGRNVTEGPYVGDGRDSPNKDQFVSGFTATPGEMNDLLEFLQSLTDDEFLADPRFSDPFAE